MKPSRVNYGAVLTMPATVLSVAAGLSASALSGTWLPAAVSAGAAGAYALLMMLAPGFRRMVRRNFEDQQLPELTQLTSLDTLVAELAPSQRQHVDSLRALKDDTLERYRRLPGGRVLAASTASQFDALLTNFVNLVVTLNGYRQFLLSGDAQELTRELAQLEADVERERSDELKAVKARRVELMRKRVSRYVEAERNRELISHQLASIEDTFRLAHEQSVSLKDPHEVGRLLESLTADVTETAETWRALEDMMPVSQELSSTASLAPARERQR